MVRACLRKNPFKAPAADPTCSNGPSFFVFSLPFRFLKSQTPSPRETWPPLTSRQKIPGGPIRTKSISAHILRLCSASPSEWRHVHSCESSVRSSSKTSYSASLFALSGGLSGTIRAMRLLDELREESETRLCGRSDKKRAVKK